MVFVDVCLFRSSAVSCAGVKRKFCYVWPVNVASGVFGVLGIDFYLFVHGLLRQLFNMFFSSFLLDTFCKFGW